MADKINTFGAIETIYRGYEFRSRLEAKYACFFDLCGWTWTYEPHDLNGWIPDFAIGETRTLVEVKPFFDASEWTEATQKIVASGYRNAVVCLGADPTVLDNVDVDGGVQIGWLFSQYDDVHSDLGKLHFGFTDGNNKLGLCPMDGGWSNIIWKGPDDLNHNKWSRVSLCYGQRERELVERWAHATNLTKWFPSGANR